MLKVKRYLRHGIKPPDQQKTKELETTQVPLPKTVILSLQQNKATACRAIVKKGETVLCGQLIAESDDPRQAPVHASVSGIVKAVGQRTTKGGQRLNAIEIEADTVQESVRATPVGQDSDPSRWLEALKRSGSTDDDAFCSSTAYKLTDAKEKNVHTLLVDGYGSEPFISNEYYEIVQYPQLILDGIKAVLRMTDIQSIKFAFPKNCTGDFSELLTAIADESNMDYIPLPSNYPQGNQSLLIYAATGLRVSHRILPSSNGILVLNVSTLSFIAKFLRDGLPHIERRLTVGGAAVAGQLNCIAPLGSRISDVLDFCGGLSSEPSQIILGGPMTGVSQFSLENSISKQTKALFALSKEEAHPRNESACIRCGRCVNVCPMRLIPNELNLSILHGKVHEDADKYRLQDCIECGCCSYVCPSSRTLLQSFRLGKAEIEAQALRFGKMDRRSTEASDG